ncbi:YncE family protein [Planctomicrobium sp. SH661]|uniref:YncE family protein n=1 Tax=Planctomicrobium sp. SH661 TaxID=3448124 RepID=UPI003F5C8505
MAHSPPERIPAWLPPGGSGPDVKWHVPVSGTLTSLAYSREAGDLFAASDSQQITRIDPFGKVVAVADLPDSIVGLSWSDDGSRGAAIVGDDVVLRLGRDLQVIQKINLPDVCLSVAVSPYGNHLAVSLANGTTLIYNERKRRIAQFETLRPLAFLRFCTSEAILFGAAEHGLICCFNLAGAPIWQQTNWSNVGRLCLTGDGDLLYLASFGHGIQTFDGDGAAVGSYVLEGTVHRIDASYEPGRLVAATIERSLYWLNAGGEMLWSTQVDDDIADLICDPFGAWAICGMARQGIYRLDWPV